MLDDEEEPDMHHPLKHAYWNIRQNFDRYLQREMYIGCRASGATGRGR